MIQKLKKSLKRFRQLTTPLRHPRREFQRTIELGVRHAMHQGPGSTVLQQTSGVSVFDQGETTLLLDHLVRELVRLHQRIEILQETVDQFVRDQGQPAITDTNESTQGRQATSSHLKAA